jgi:hypothetical protein
MIMLDFCLAFFLLSLGVDLRLKVLWLGGELVFGF